MHSDYDRIWWNTDRQFVAAPWQCVLCVRAVLRLSLQTSNTTVGEAFAVIIAAASSPMRSVAVAAIQCAVLLCVVIAQQ